MAVEQVTYVVLPALIMGAIIGLIELFFVHADEVGMGWFAHGLHALPFTMLFTFAAMNVSWVLTFIPGVPDNMWVTLAVRAGVSIVGMIKIAGAAAIGDECKRSRQPGNRRRVSARALAGRRNM